MTSAADAQIQQEKDTKERIERFVSRFGNEAYRFLAQHAALPLVLTPDLVHYLRTQFLGEAGVPWEAEVDLLLSDLCSQVGYELYSMDTQVRACLMAEMQQNPAYGPQRMQEVAQVLISYVNFLRQIDPRQRQKELEAQRWAAMTFLGDERCQQAVEEIAQRLKELGHQAEEGEISATGIRSELARLARITQELAPQLQDAPELVDYARLVEQVLRRPDDIKPADLTRVHRVGEVELTLSPQILPPEKRPPQYRTEFEGFPPIQRLSFRTGKLVEPGSVLPPLVEQTVEVVTVYFEDEGTVSAEAAAPELENGIELFAVPIEIATVEYEPSSGGGWVIQREPGEARIYEERLDSSLALEMVEIPGGTFVMGSPDDEPQRYDQEGPQREVTVNPFFMGRYPVTQVQWRFLAELPQVERELKLNPSRFEGAMNPVERVSWYDAVEFCRRLSQHTERVYRLPTEVEWEYACRAGTTTPFHFGETIMSELANYQASEVYNGGPKGDYREKTTPVDYFGVANRFGLSDMHGNVLEWCEDHWHESYEGAPSDGSAWLTENSKAKRVLRGGSWLDFPRVCRSAYRDYYSPGDDNFIIGFRVVCSAPRT